MAKCNALHAIINSNCLLSTLKAPFNIECHFLSIIIHIYIHNTFCYSIIELHHPLIFISSFSFLNFSSCYSFPKIKNKTLFFSLLVHIYSYTSSSFSLPSLPFYLPPTRYFTVTLPSSFSLFYNLTLLLPILFVHIYGCTSSNLSLPSLPLYLPHYSSLHCYTSFIIFSFL